MGGDETKKKLIRVGIAAICGIGIASSIAELKMKSWRAKYQQEFGTVENPKFGQKMSAVLTSEAELRECENTLFPTDLDAQKQEKILQAIDDLYISEPSWQIQAKQGLSYQYLPLH